MMMPYSDSGESLAEVNETNDLAKQLKMLDEFEASLLAKAR